MENDYSININNNEYILEIEKEPDIAIELNEQGPPGSSGNGIDHIEVIEETQSYTKYRIVYTDQEAGHYDYIVYNGEKGDKGDTGETGNGISGISKTGSSGIVDTYTITLTNGDTETFTVTNGRDGIDGQDGTDGYSPTATVTKSGNTTTISITDKDGTTTETIKDGIVYQDGTGIDISNDTISVADYNNILKNDAGPSNLGISANNNTILMDNTGNKKNLYLHFSSAQSSDIMALIYNGLITDSLLSNNIARTSDIPTQASDVNALPDTTTINDLTTTAQQNAINSGATSNNIGQIATNTANLNSLQTTVTNNYNTLDNRITSEVSNLNSAISTEATNRQNADNNLQSQIDALVVASDVFDIVGTYAELQTYDISTVPVNDIIKVLVDSTHNNAATYYRCVENDNVKSWSYIGAEGAYYTKSEADGRFVEQTTTINGQALSNNITLTASDVGALPDSTTIGNGTLTIQKNGSTIDTFGANDTGNTTVNITVPTDTGDLTNNAGYIKDINRTDVTTALGYTPYDSTNPDGYTDNVGTVTSVNNTQPDANGNVTLSIPAAQVNSDWNASSGVAQILNKPTLSTVATTGDYDDLTNKPTIPTKTSDLTNDSGFIPNTATRSDSLTIQGTANTGYSTINIGSGSSSTGDHSVVIGVNASNTNSSSVVIGRNAGASSTDTVAIGYRASASNTNAIAIGYDAEASGGSSTAIGDRAEATGVYSIQIGKGTNSTGNSLAVGFISNNYQLLDGTTGLIPDARISSNIARTSDLSTVATSGSYNDLSNKPTIPSTSNFVTTNTEQNVTARKTFVGEKAIYFKQSSSNNKLGFTLYNNRDAEVGGLEYNPSNPSSNILALNAPKTGNTLLGFRYWGTPASNIIIPKPTSGDYYIPLSFKNGSSTVTTNSLGVADLSNLIPTIATSVSASSTNAKTVGAKLFYDTVGDIETLLSEV